VEKDGNADGNSNCAALNVKNSGKAESIKWQEDTGFLAAAALWGHALGS